MTGILAAPILMVAPVAFEFGYVPSSAATSTADLTTYTFTDVPFGDAAATRTIVVAIAGRAGANRSISSVTIAGISATEINQSSNTAGGFDSICGIYRADVPTGTSGTIEVVFSAGMVRSGIASYRMIAGKSGSYDSTVVNAGTSGTINIPAGGAALASAMSVASTSASWSGLAEDVDVTIESAITFSTASDTFVSAQSGRSVSVTWGSSTQPSMCIASFEPA